MKACPRWRTSPSRGELPPSVRPVQQVVVSVSACQLGTPEQSRHGPCSAGAKRQKPPAHAASSSSLLNSTGTEAGTCHGMIMHHFLCHHRRFSFLLTDMTDIHLVE